MVASIVLALALAASDDRDVIQTSLLSFFTPAEWHSYDWEPKEYVVLRTQFNNKERPDFQMEFESMFNRCRREWKSLSEAKESEPDAARREQLTTLYNEANQSYMGMQAAVGPISNGGSYSAPMISPLTSFAWDKRIRISDEKRSLDAPKPESMAVYASADRPCYSRDGHWAITSFAIPWSMYHSARVWFLLERGETVWRVRAWSSEFYV